MTEIDREQAMVLMDQIFGIDPYGESAPRVQRSPAVRAWFAAHLGNQLLPDNSTCVTERVMVPAAQLMREVANAILDPIKS